MDGFAVKHKSGFLQNPKCMISAEGWIPVVPSYREGGRATRSRSYVAEISKARSGKKHEKAKWSK